MQSRLAKHKITNNRSITQEFKKSTATTKSAPKEAEICRF